MEDDALRVRRESIVEEYKVSISRKVAFLVISLAVLLTFLCLSLSIGTRYVDPLSIPGIIIDHLRGMSYEYGTPRWWDDIIIFDTRLPRVLAGAFAGAGLALCGATMQSILKNPMASPYTMGLSSGASLGAVIAIVLGFSLGSSVGMYGVSFNAFVFALVPVLVMMALSNLIRMSPVTLILVGVALSYFFNSLTTLILVGSEEGTLQSAFLWQVGTLANIKWEHTAIMGIFTVVGSVILLSLHKQLNLLMLGDDSARTMGLDAGKFRLLGMVFVSLLTATLVSFIGIIGFIGLISPHLARLALGGDNRFVLPASMLIGANLMVAADMVSRTVAIEAIPVGSVLAFIGGPIFLYLIIGRRKNYEFM